MKKNLQPWLFILIFPALACLMFSCKKGSSLDGDSGGIKPFGSAIDVSFEMNDDTWRFVFNEDGSFFQTVFGDEDGDNADRNKNDIDGEQNVQVGGSRGTYVYDYGLSVIEIVMTESFISLDEEPMDWHVISLSNTAFRGEWTGVVCTCFVDEDANMISFELIGDIADLLGEAPGAPPFWVPNGDSYNLVYGYTILVGESQLAAETRKMESTSTWNHSARETSADMLLTYSGPKDSRNRLRIISEMGYGSETVNGSVRELTDYSGTLELYEPDGSGWSKIGEDSFSSGDGDSLIFMDFGTGFAEATFTILFNFDYLFYSD